MMIFEEKYGDVVRMLTMADSVELCGGTHARATGDIGLFKIVSEQGVAAGVRRIMATTGENSLSYLRDLEERLVRAARAAKASPTDLAEKIDKILLRERALEKQVEELERKLSSGGGGAGVEGLLANAREVSGVKVLAVRSEVSDRGALRELAEQLRDKLGQAIVLVGSVADGKAQLVLTVSKPLTDRFRAGDLIRTTRRNRRWFGGRPSGHGSGRPAPTRRSSTRRWSRSTRASRRANRSRRNAARVTSRPEIPRALARRPGRRRIGHARGREFQWRRRPRRWRGRRRDRRARVRAWSRGLPRRGAWPRLKPARSMSHAADSFT